VLCNSIILCICTATNVTVFLHIKKKKHLADSCAGERISTCYDFP